MLRWLVFAALVAGAVPAQGHDFWLEPARFRSADGEVVALRFLVGDGPSVEDWNLRWRLAQSLRSYGPAGVRDHQASIRPTAAGAAGGASATLNGAGTHVVAFESALSESDLPAGEFNDYLTHEGLTPAIEARRVAKAENSRGREIYSRRAKVLVQVGTEPSDHALRPIGQTLEIVPERNPYASSQTELPLRIYYRGQPLAGARVTLVDLDRPDDRRSTVSDADGRVQLAIGTAGRWRATTVWTAPTEHPHADWDTIFASLTFGR